MQLLRSADLGYDAGPVLRAVDLTLAVGDHLVLLGRSGAGKSTLLMAARAALTARGLRVALVPQDHALVPQLSALRNVLMGRLEDHGAVYNLRTLIRPRRADRAAAGAVLAQVGLSDIAARPVEALSGGQRQRVALARAIYRGGDVLLGDEPLSAVDPHQAGDLAALLRAAFPTSILALHDVDLAMRFGNRMIGLAAGSVRFDLVASDVNAARIGDLYAR